MLTPGEMLRKHSGLAVDCRLVIKVLSVLKLKNTFNRPVVADQQLLIELCCGGAVAV